MIFIVEGMDRCGKDTLIRHIRKNVLVSPKTTMIHCSSTPNVSYPQDWSRIHYHELLKSCIHLHEDGWNIILNRSHLGEAVYGPMFRGTEADWVFNLDQDLVNSVGEFGVSLIVLIDSPENLILRDDGLSLYQSENNIRSVRNAFSDVFDRSYITNKFLFDHSQIAPEAQLDTLMKTAEDLILCRQ